MSIWWCVFLRLSMCSQFYSYNYHLSISTRGIKVSFLVLAGDWLIEENAARVCGLRGDLGHLTPPASCLPHARQLQQIFGISRSPITACEYYCTWTDYETLLLLSRQFTQCHVQILVGRKMKSSQSSAHWNVQVLSQAPKQSYRADEGTNTTPQRDSAINRKSTKHTRLQMLKCSSVHLIGWLAVCQHHRVTCQQKLPWIRCLPSRRPLEQVLAPNQTWNPCYFSNCIWMWNNSQSVHYQQVPDAINTTAVGHHNSGNVIFRTTFVFCQSTVQSRWLCLDVCKQSCQIVNITPEFNCKITNIRVTAF